MPNPGLTFVNNTSSDVSLMYEYYNTGCGSADPWTKTGWFIIPAGGSHTVISNDLRTQNQYLYWWADPNANAFGQPSWGSQNGYEPPTYVTYSAFNQCDADNSNGCTNLIELQALDFNGNYGMIVTLNSPPSSSNFTITPIPPPQGGPPPTGTGTGTGTDGDIWDDGTDGTDDGGDGGDGG